MYFHLQLCKRAMLVDAYILLCETPVLGYAVSLLIAFGHIQRARDYLKSKGDQKLTEQQRMGLCFVDMVSNTLIYNTLIGQSGMFEGFGFVPFMLFFILLFIYDEKKQLQNIEICYNAIQIPLLVIDCCEKMSKIRGQYRWSYFIAQQSRPSWRFMLDNVLFKSSQAKVDEQNYDTVTIGEQLSRFIIITICYTKQLENVIVVLDITNAIIGTFDIKQIRPYGTPFCWVINKVVDLIIQKEKSSNKPASPLSADSQRPQNSTPMTIESQMINAIS